MIDKNLKIFIAGDRSQVAIDLHNLLLLHGYISIISCNSSNLDLRNALKVKKMFIDEKPDVVFIIAAKTGNVKKQQIVPFDYLSDNLLIALNLINACIENDVKRVIYFSSDSVLPFYSDGRLVDETDLLKDPVSNSVEAYSLSKIMGIKMCSYANTQMKRLFCVSLLPCYIYGNTSKGLIFSMIDDFIKAKEKSLPFITIWGNEDLRYKFINSKDLANAAYFVMNNELKYDCYIVAPENQIAKKNLALMIANQIEYKGKIIFDESKPIRQGINASSARLLQEGWKSSISLEEGIKDMINWYKEKMILQE